MLKNKLFYFVVFAAAAIFAVTLVACDNSDPAGNADPFARVNQAAVFYPYPTDMNAVDDTTPFAGMSLVQSVGGGLSHSTPPKNSGLFAILYKDTVALNSEKKLVVGDKGEVYAYLPVTNEYAPFSAPTYKVVGDNSVLDTIAAGAEGDRYLCVKIGGTVAAADDKIAVSGATLAKVYEVTILYSSGSAASGYYKGDAAGDVAVAGLKTGDHYLIGDAIEGFAAITTADKIPGTGFGSTTTVVYEAEVIKLGAAGTKTTNYFFVADNTNLTATGITTAGYVAKVKSLAVTGFAAVTTNAQIPGIGFGTDTAVVYGADVITVGISGGKVKGYYKVASDTVLTAASVTAAANVVKVDASPTTGLTVVGQTTYVSYTDAKVGEVYEVLPYVVTAGTASAYNPKYFKVTTAAQIPVATITATDVVKVTKVTDTSGWYKY